METFERHLLMTQTGVNEMTGELVPAPERVTHFEPVLIRKNTKVSFECAADSLQVFFYDPYPLDRTIHSYFYENEGRWTPYTGKTEVPAEKNWICQEDCYCRFVLDQKQVHGRQYLDQIVTIRQEAGECAAWITQEAEETALRCRPLLEEETQAYLLLADTHYAAGCNWQDTCCALQAVSKRITLNGIIHLGDLTDGWAPLDETKRCAQRILHEMKKIAPVTLCIGNHDYNHFRQNETYMDVEEAARFYLPGEGRWYCKTFGDVKCFFLESFDPVRRERYGFCDEEMQWFRKELNRTAPHTRILVFSHVPPDVRIHVWSDEIINGKKMIQCLIRTAERRHLRILGWIHGHNHADQIWCVYPFPVIGIGCSKTEAFYEHKPLASYTPWRELRQRTQELFDILLINKDGISLIRYGAGEDRVRIPDGKHYIRWR